MAVVVEPRKADLDVSVILTARSLVRLRLAPRAPRARRIASPEGRPPEIECRGRVMVTSSSALIGLTQSH